jgi:4-amino-4-deoxy-L-arabinose transferase-like glycosyltransferase
VRPTAARAFVLGFIIGVDLMAKWSFLLVVLSLGVALAVTRETRRIYCEPRTLLVLAGVALPILPFALWLATIDPDLVGRRRATVTGSPESSSLCSGWRSQTRVPGDDK